MDLVRQAGAQLTTQSVYTIKRPFWSFMGRTFRVFSTDGQLIMFVKHPIFKMREEFTVYADESQSQPLLLIKARQAIAINFSYDITDIATGQMLGTVQKQGLKSILRDKFLILDPHGTEIGYCEEQGAALLRRFIPWIMGKHAVFTGGNQVAFVRQIFRFFTKEFNVELQPGSPLDPRFTLAVALLALMADAKREERN